MVRSIKALVMSLALGAAALVTLQAVPYGRAHDNPPVVQEPAWDSARTRELAMRACFDCHSNETTWPGYADVAPLSWVMQRDVDTARSVLNFSDWRGPNDVAMEAGPTVLRREMPPRSYKLAHPHARLTDDETVELARGLDATFGTRHTVATAP